MSLCPAYNVHHPFCQRDLGKMKIGLIEVSIDVSLTTLDKVCYALLCCCVGDTSESQSNKATKAMAGQYV